MLYKGFYLLVACCFIIPSPTFSQRCRFNGPQDAQTLRNGNFITNFGTGNCLKIDRFGGRNPSIILDRCAWNNIFPTKEQLFEVRNHKDGSIIKPTYDSSNERCLDTYGGNLIATTCIPKSNDQTWLFNHVRGGMYQIMKRSNRRCLKALKGNGNNIAEAFCSPSDPNQLWRICTKGL